MNRLIPTAGCLALAATIAPPALADYTVTFDAGAEGWAVNGFSTVTPAGGNPGAHIHFFVFETFGITCANSTHAEFVGDYTKIGEVKLSIDMDVETINFFGTEVSRQLVVELRDYDNPPGGYPYVSVWFDMGVTPPPAAGWKTFSAEVTDVNGMDLPPGWGGYGDEDPMTFEPILPADRTWTDVLQGVDQIVFTTYVPGYFYGGTQFNIRFDNIRIEGIGALPCPGDLDGDNSVGFTDLNVLLADWGPCPGCDGDLDGDDSVGFTDLNILLADWGPCT